MRMSLLKELQQITERTYERYSGINLEDFIIGKKRFVFLSHQSRPHVRELSDVARVFFRKSGERLYLAIYFSDYVIHNLEANDPRKGLNEKNIYPFIVFVEEINHGVHTAMKFLAGETDVHQETFIRDLELLAKIDSYQVLKFFLAYFNPSNQLETFDRLWIKHHLFERANTHYRSTLLSHRYGETNALSEKFTRYLDGMHPENRLAELRHLRGMSYPAKASYIRMLP